MTRLQKILLYGVVPFMLLATACGYSAYRLVQSPIATDDKAAMLYITPGDTLSALIERLPLSHRSDRIWINLAARIEGLPAVADSTHMTGAYRIGTDISPLRLAHRIHLRQQTPVRITFNNIRTKAELAERVTEPLMMTGDELLHSLSDSVFCRSLDTDTANVESFFLPDTYEVYWTVTPEALVERMHQEYLNFWTPERRARLDSLHLTPRDASILASIAEEETANRSERGVVARLYWNRLQQQMPLQADPTVKYAVGDFTLRRILKEHLQVESPYNTYRHQGLPPGPIRVCEKATLDTLLYSRPHPYIYMCAKEDFSGRHNFAVSYKEHLVNAKRYQQALDARE